MKISKFGLLVVILTTCVSLCSAFKCTSVIDISSCSQLEGCNWNQEVCDGTFSPPCYESNCYYIDPIEGSDLQNGSPQTPFKTLTQGFHILHRNNGSLIVINYNNQPHTDIINYVNITSSIIIKPLFNESSFVISLTNFNTLAASLNHAITISAGVLEIIGATVNSATTKSPLKTIFQVNNAQLLFYNVSIFEDVGDIYLVSVNTNLTSSKFSYVGGNYSESSFLFNLLAGTHFLSKLEFKNIKSSNILLNISQSIVTIDGVNVNGGSALFLSVSGASTEFIAKNINFREYSGNFIFATDTIPFLMLMEIKFVDLDLVSSTSFMSFEGPISKQIILSYILFRNITVKSSLLSFVNYGTANTVMNVQVGAITMENIKRNVSSSSQTSQDTKSEPIWAGGVCALAQNNVYLFVDISNFSNISSHCFELKDSALSFSWNIFDNSALVADSNNRGASDADDNANGVSWILFDGGIAPTLTSFGVLLYTNSVLQFCRFIENKIPTNFGGVIRFTGLSRVNMETTENIMINNRALYGGAFYSENPFLNLESSGDIFINNTAQYGGAIYKASLISSRYPLYGSTTLTIDGATFLENKASTKGGSIFVGKESISITNSIFISSQAKYGGALYYVQTQRFSSRNIIIKNITFDSNSAEVLGAAMILFTPLDIANPLINSSSLNLTNNTDAKNRNVFAGKISYSRFSFYQILVNQDDIENNDENLSEWMTDLNKTNLMHRFNTSKNSTSNFTLSHKSGHTLNQIIAIEIFDESGQPADFVNDGGINVEIVGTQKDVSGLQAYLSPSPITTSFKNGAVYIKNQLVIYGQPRTTATLSFQGFNTDSGFLLENDFVLNQTIQVYFEDCELGDTYNPVTTACKTCPQGSYSLSDPYKTPFCTPCDDQLALCFGGSKIAPKPGFWRYNITSDNILECPINQACVGGDRDKPQGECDFPYEGNLCNRCTTGYVKDSNSKKCVNCKGNVLYYAKAILFSVAQLIITFITLRSSIKQASVTQSAAQIPSDKSEEFNSSLLRIAFSYFQIWGIIVQLNISWPDWVLDSIAFVGGLSPGGQDWFSPNCILKFFWDNDEDVYFIQLIITLIKPFFSWISLVFVYIIYLLCARKLAQSDQKLRNYIRIFFLILAYMYQPSIIKATFILFRCKNFSSAESPVYFMVDQTEVQCWTKFHILWSVAIGLPNLVLWTIILPLLLFKVISKDFNKCKEGEYSFIYTGLKRERFYWELVIMIRKVLFIIILVFFNMISDETQVFAVFGLVYIFVYIQYKFWPFEDKRSNFLEIFSLLCLTAMAYSAISLTLEGATWLNNVVVFSALLLNLVYLLTLTFYFVKSYKVIAKRNIQNLLQSSKNRLNHPKDKMDSKSASNNIKSPKSPDETPKSADQDLDLKFPSILSEVKEIEENQPQPQ